MNEYSYKLQQHNGYLDLHTNTLLKIMRTIFRILFIANFMSFAPIWINNEIYEKWLNLFIIFLKINTPIDLKQSTNVNEYCKTRKWCTRLVLRIMQLYGRPQYVLIQDIRSLAELFMDHYALKLLQLFYNILQNSYLNNEFLYSKTAAPT
eukprot:219744_1